jgi:hypothetical protein
MTLGVEGEIADTRTDPANQSFTGLVQTHGAVALAFNEAGPPPIPIPPPIPLPEPSRGLMLATGLAFLTVLNRVRRRMVEGQVSPARTRGARWTEPITT